MSNLMPEKRMDKNGRLVTKHVRTGSAPISGKKIPVPTLGSDRYTKVADILSRAGLHKGAWRRKAEERLMNMGAETFALMEEIEKAENYEGGEKSYQHFVQDLLTRAPEDKLDSYLRNSLAFEEDVEYMLDIRMQKAMHVIPEFAPYADDLGAHPEVLAKARNLVRFIDDLNIEGPHKALKGTSSVIRFENRKLEKALIENLSAADEFSAWASDHGEHSSTLVESCSGELMLMVIEANDDQRDEIADLMINHRVTDPEMINLMVLEQPEVKERVLEYMRDGIDRAEVIKALLDQSVQPSLSSGVL